MRPIVVIIITLFLLASLVAPSQVRADPATLHPGDKVAVTVYNHPELSSEPTLDGGGYISLPLVGEIPAQSLSLKQLSHTITLRLRHYVIGPAVDVQFVAGGSSIFVVGPVAGVLNFTPGESLVAALSEVQSLRATPAQDGSTPKSPVIAPTIDLRALRDSGVDLRYITLKRDTVSFPPIDLEKLVADGESGPTLVAGDVISLRDRPIRVALIGLVTHPITAHLYPDEPLRNALRQAGGVDQADSAFRITLVRQGVRSELTVLSPEFSAPACNGDALIVPQAPRVVVAGQVNKPGELVVKGDASLLSALYLAGGPQSNGDLGRVMVLHQGKQVSYDVTRTKNGVLLNNPILADGDSIFVPAGRRVDFSQLFQGIVAASALHI